jgi:DHA1 family tetracycline resistance protein-like MFS transporter
MPASRAAMAFIYVTATLDMLAFGLMIPVLPFLIRDFTGGDTARAAEVSGLFGTVFAVTQFFFAPVLGALSDRFGRRPVILLSNLGLGLDYLLMALAPNLSWLLVGRLVAGVTSSSFSTASAYVADTAPPERRARAFGLLGATFNFGFIVGPALGGSLAEVDPRLPFWVAAGLSFANSLYGLLVLPESLPAERRAPFVLRSANPLGALALLRSQPQLLALAGVAFLNNLGHDVNPQVFAFYGAQRYGWDQATVGFTLVGVGLCGIAVSAGLVGPIVGAFGERRTLLVGLLFGVLGFSLQAWAPTGRFFWAGVPLIALWGLYHPALQGLLVEQVDPSEQGRLQGAIQSLRSLTGLATPLLYTQTFAFFARPDGWQLPGAAYWLAALLVGGALAVAARGARSAPAQ